jgi:hypothetical protein
VIETPKGRLLPWGQTIQIGSAHWYGRIEIRSPIRLYGNHNRKIQAFRKLTWQSIWRDGGDSHHTPAGAIIAKETIGGHFYLNVLQFRIVPDNIQGEAD